MFNDAEAKDNLAAAPDVLDHVVRTPCRRDLAVLHRQRYYKRSNIWSCPSAGTQFDDNFVSTAVFGSKREVCGAWTCTVRVEDEVAHLAVNK